MMKKRFLSGLVAGLFLIGMVVIAEAAPITSASDPSLIGGDVIDFEGEVIGTYSSLTIGNVTFSTTDSGQVRIQSTWAGSFNTTGNRYLDNEYLTKHFRFDFATDVDAFGFNWGASNDPWTLSAYDSSNNPLELYNLPITLDGNSGTFVGLNTAGISYATLDTTYRDWVLIDNFTTDVEPVPEPATIALLGIGLIGLAGGAARRKFKKKEVDKS